VLPINKCSRLLFLALSTVFSGVAAGEAGDSFWKRTLPESRKGQMYFSWGYNRAVFGKSNIHLNGPDYDFTVYQVKAKDRPSNFTFDDYFNPAKISIPQFNARLGYQINDRWAVSLGTDHMKYVMDNNQYARMSGVVHANASEKYAGSYLNETVLISPDLLKFEHTDGLNLISLDIERSFLLYKTPGRRFAIHFNTAVGGFLVVPKSDVRVFGEGSNNNFHVAGYCMNLRSGIRLEFLRNLFFQVDTRGGYMSLPSIFVKTGSSQLADQNIRFLEFYASIGGYFRLPKIKKQRFISPG
jgi:hypothetical protein